MRNADGSYPLCVSRSTNEDRHQAVLGAQVGAEGAPLIRQFQRWPARMTSWIRAVTEVLVGMVVFMANSTACRLRG
jgi:hypothetical protein